MAVNTLQMNLTRGALHPMMHARVDTDHFQSGVKELQDWLVLRYGGLTRMPGSLHLGTAKTVAKTTRWLEFSFNRLQVYAIEAGHQYFRFWTLEGNVISGGVPYEVVTPYAAADLRNIQFRQIGDVIYMTCRGHRPKQLTRLSETNWTLTDTEFKDGPYLKMNETPTTLQPSTRNSTTPEMTAANAPSGNVTQSSGSGYLALNGAKSSAYTTGASNSGWIAYRLPGVIRKVVDSYWLAMDGSANSHQAPVSWTLSGSNDGGITFVVVDSRDRETGWGSAETRFYEFFNKTAYNMYKFEWTGTDGAGSATRIGELGLNEAGDSQTPWTLTASSTTGINDDTGFVDSDVGRMIRVQGSDRKWRWCRIVTRVSATVVTIRMYGHALPDYSPFANWRLGAWSDSVGWPRCIGVYEDRLVYAGTDADPVSGWATRSGGYDNFGTSEPIVSDDGLEFRLTGGELNEILWLHDDKNIVIGTASSIRSVGRNDPNKQFGPDNLRQYKQSKVPTSDIPPISIGEMIIFVDGSRRRICEASFVYDTDSYQARDLSALNEHLLECGVKRLTYQPYPNRALFCIRDDGAIGLSTYDRDQKVFGMGVGKFTGGVDETEVLDTLALAGTDGMDEVLALVYRRSGSDETVTVERLAPYYRSQDANVGNPVYAHDAWSRSGAPITTANVPHLAGYEVGVWADGVDIGDLEVDDTGDITFPIPVSDVVIGHRKVSRGRTLRVPEYGQRDGTGLAKRIVVHAAHIDLYETPYLLLASGDGAFDEIIDENDTEVDPLAPKPMKTGMFPVTVEGGWRTGGELVFETDRMYPATIRALSLTVDGE